MLQIALITPLASRLKYIWYQINIFDSVCVSARVSRAFVMFAFHILSGVG